MTGGAHIASYVSLLRNRNYRLWFLSSTLSSLGDWVGLFALQILVVSMAAPGSRIALFGLGGIMMARLLPSMFFAPVAGVLADRYDRRRLLVATDLLRGGLFIGMAFSRELWTLFTLTFLVECFSLLYASAKDASLPTIVKRRHLTQANQLNLLVTYGPLPLGAVVATAMVALAGVVPRIGLPPVDATQLALLLNAATFFAGGVLISRIQLPRQKRRSDPSASTGIMEELREGMRFIRDLPLIRALISGVVGVFFGAGVIVTLGPEFVRSELGRPSTDWPLLMTMVGLGLLLGIALVPFVTARFRKERLFPIFLTAAAAMATITATLPSFAVTQPAGFLLGALAGLSFVIGYTLLHEHTEDDVRARTFAAFYTATRASMFAALGLAPFLAGAIGTGTLILGNRAFTMSGIRIVILLGGLVALASAASAWRGMYRALRLEDRRERRPIRLRRGDVPEGAELGVFIVFEGVEGSGKSTQVEALAETLRAEGHDVVVTREPGGSPVAERIRALLLDPNAGDMHPRTEALLYAAARVEHVQRVVLPALEAGKVVVCDRYIDSSLAYQGFARQLGDVDVFEINRWAIGGVLPDVVVLLHLDPEDGMRRVAERARRREAEPGEAKARLAWMDQRGADRIEREDMEFHRAVADGYLALVRRDRSRYVVIDAAADAGTVSRQVRSGLHAWVPLPAPERTEPAGADEVDGADGGARPEAG